MAEQIIRRDDGVYFIGSVDATDRPYEMRGPYATATEAIERGRLEDECDTHIGVLAASEELQDFDAAHPDAVLWSDSNGDGDAIDSWTWEVVHE